MAASDFLACIPYSMPSFGMHSVRHAKQLVLVLAARSRRETFHGINLVFRSSCHNLQGFHEAMASWLGGRLHFATNHSAGYRSLKEFDWIGQGNRPPSNEAMVS